MVKRKSVHNRRIVFHRSLTIDILIGFKTEYRYGFLEKHCQRFQRSIRITLELFKHKCTRRLLLLTEFGAHLPGICNVPARGL